MLSEISGQLFFLNRCECQRCTALVSYVAFIVYICIVVYYFVFVVFCASWKAVLQHYRGRDGATDGTPKKKMARESDGAEVR